MRTPPWDSILRPDIAFLIALPEEFRVLADDLADEWYPRPNPRFHGSDFLFVGEGGYRCTATILPRMGPTPASQVSMRLLDLRPAVIVNLGIAGGFKSRDLRIGDVIVPRQVDAYDETGKVEGIHWQRRGSAYRPSPGLVEMVHQLEFTARDEHGRWVKDGADHLARLREGPDQERIAKLVQTTLLRDRPIVSTHHLASGSFVVASKPFAAWLREANADIYAGEMEAAGMMAAAEYQREPVETLVVRGISDHVDADKSEVDAVGDGALRRLAMENAWRLVCALMRQGLLPRADVPSGAAAPQSSVAQSRPSTPPPSPAVLASLSLASLLPPTLPQAVPYGRTPLPAGDSEGARRLLNSGRLPRPRHSNPGALLNARHAEVPFHGWLRSPELARLHGWCTSDDAVAVTVLHGPGGAGKTRLALELCERMTAEGFVAGLVSASIPTSALDTLLAVSARLLVVLDYAEIRSGLGAWLDRVALVNLAGAQRLRIILVVRNLGGWWEALLERGSEVRALLARDPPIALQPELVPLPVRAQVFREAVAHFSRARPIAPLPEPPAGLVDAEFGNILYLHMSALAAVEGRSMRPEQLLEETRLRERTFWLTAIPAADESAERRIGRQVDQAIAALILAGGAADRDAALRLLTRAGVEPPLREALLLRLGDLYPGTGVRDSGDAYLTPLAPDLLAEAHTRAVLAHRDTPSRFVAGLFEGSPPEALRPALQWLGRLDHHGDGSDSLFAAFRDLLTEDLPNRAEVALQVAINFAERSLTCQLVDVLADALQARGTAAIAEDLLRLGLVRSIPLHRVRAWIYETVLAASPPLAPNSRFIASIGLAALNTDRDGYAAAKQQSENAIEAAHAWARDDTSALWASALGFGMLGTVASELGDREQALDMLREGLKLCETVRRAAPDEYHDLELFLRMTYGHGLLQVGAFQEAHAELTAVAAMYEASHLPPISEHALCQFLLGIACRNLGQFESSAVHLRLSAKFQRELAATKRGDHIADLARTLGWLAGIEIRLGAVDVARDVARESVLLWEEVRQADPQMAASGLAFALANLAVAANCRGEYGLARAHAARSVSLWRIVCETTPAFGLPLLASALDTLGNTMVQPGEAAESFAAFDEALSLHRPLAEQYPLLYSSCLARTLLFRGQRSALLGDAAGALQSLSAAAATYGALPEVSRAAHSLEWGLSLYLQIGPLDDFGRRDEALACSEAVLAVVSNPLAESGPFHDLLIGATNFFRGQVLAERDDDNAAVTALEASVDPLRRSIGIRPEAASLLSYALVLLAEYLPDLSREREAALLEVVRLQHGFLAAGNPPQFELADSLLELSSLYLEREDAAKASVMLDEARPLMAHFCAEAPDEHEAGLVFWFGALVEMDPDEDARREHVHTLESLLRRSLVGDEEQLLRRMGQLLGTGVRFVEMGRSAAAAIAACTVITACNEQSRNNPEFLLMTVQAYEFHAAVLKSDGRRSDRVLALRGAMAARKRLDTIDPKRHRAGLLTCMNELADALANAWMGEEARRLRAESKALRKEGMGERLGSTRT